MKHIALASALACLLLAACTGNSSQQQQQEQNTQPAGTDSFYAADRRDNTQNTQYQSTGDAALLNVALPKGTSNQTLHYDHITIYYNPKLRLPNCVAYELTATQVNMCSAPDAEKRDNYNFYRDSKVKACPEWWEYKNTGYDKGHMAPAMDMKWDKRAMEQCFLMTNICPQNHALNDGAWRHTEEAVHSWARKARRLVIFTGPIVDSPVKYTGKNKDIAVPSRFFKVVYAPEQRRAIAFVYDNRPAGKSWTQYATTIDEAERASGIDFLAALPNNIEDVVESRQNIRDWPTYTPRR